MQESEEVPGARSRNMAKTMRNQEALMQESRPLSSEFNLGTEEANRRRKLDKNKARTKAATYSFFLQM